MKNMEVEIRARVENIDTFTENQLFILIPGRLLLATWLSKIMYTKIIISMMS